MSDFKPFAAAVHANFNEMSKHELYTVDITGDELYAAYLAAFPEGTNPIFRTRTEHDCSCCRNFIKNLGTVVCIVDGVTLSVWDLTMEQMPEPYETVAAKLATLIASKPITGIYRTKEPSYGVEQNRETAADGSIAYTWHHFHGKVAAKHFNTAPGTAIGEFNSRVQVFRRGLVELTPESLSTVIDLAEANNLYKGEESLPALRAFQQLQEAYRANVSETFVFQNADNRAALIRNTAIGTLLIDLSEGKDLEGAVKSYEDKVSGTNYKRPKALITPAMVKQAMQMIADEGLEPALARRHANIGDITINNVLWADRSAAKKMKGGLEGLLMDAAAAPKAATFGTPEDISIADFMANVVPQATSIELVVRNAQQGNFMSVTAPVHADAPSLFKWDNGFAWSYSGSVADAIKERVKAAGGQVEGDLCCRLAWEYTDDLDLYMVEPTGSTVYFGNRRAKSPNGGMLDVDANGMDGIRNDPVENIFYADRSKMLEGVYSLEVGNYTRRSNGTGFEVQIEFDGQMHHIVSDMVVSTSGRVKVAQIEYKNGEFAILKSMPASSGAAKPGEKWGVKTEQPTKVATIMHSPNHWDGNQTGNRHYFFILEGCKNPEPVRGVYNEFLKPELDKHRKVFEVLGDRTKAPPVDDQLSGVGFSTTKRDAVLVNVTGAKLRKSYNITF